MAGHGPLLLRGTNPQRDLCGTASTLQPVRAAAIPEPFPCSCTRGAVAERRSEQQRGYLDRRHVEELHITTFWVRSCSGFWERSSVLRVIARLPRGIGRGG